MQFLQTDDRSDFGSENKFPLNFAHESILIQK